MTRVLITSGPTREYLDPVRYLSNASSGRLGRELAATALELGDSVVVVTGPVEVSYPARAKVIHVVTTAEMLAAAAREFQSADVFIAAAAPCDYRPERIRPHKISKTGKPHVLELVETPDILATLAQDKGSRLVVGFALETHDQRQNAMRKLRRKFCDLVVLNGPAAMNSGRIDVEVLDASGEAVLQFSGPKQAFARDLMRLVHQARGARPHAAEGAEG